MAVRIAIIEDDEALRDGLRLAFELDGWEVASAGTMREGNRLLMEGNCDLAILDCNLPDGSGFDMIKKLREFSRLPVLMLTARNSEIDEIRGLELGVDDFMKKPFSLAVLKARARKMLKKESQPSLLSSGDVTVDLKTGEVLRDSERVSLSNTELRLLVFLLEHAGRILSKEQILDSIWDADRNFVDENTLAVAIRRLRLKIETDPSNPKHIRTIHGMGYIWQEQKK
ncbi:MAG: response regulator transcription factor [Merdimonas faecis]|jgi:hypothetical protein|uniref:response regulator transcription factor n=1 Tax=Merdimonas faecis TaxID=1653435 RepID=UPI0039907076